MTHLVLGGASFVPGAGTPAALLDAGVYAAEGDNNSAAIAAASAIPLVKGVKVAAEGSVEAAKVIKAARAADEAADTAAGAIASKTTKNISPGEPGQAPPPGAVTTKPTPASEPAGSPAQTAGTTPPQLSGPKTAPRTGAPGAPSLTEHLNSVLPPHRGVPADQLGLTPAERQALPHALHENPNYTYFEHSGTGFVRRTPSQDSVHVARPPDSTNMGRWGENAKKSADAQAAEDPDGVVYLRTNKDGGKYVGRAKNEDRYAARQKEHGRANPDAGYRFKELGRTKSGKDLQRAEQENIDAHGGPKNKSNPNGQLENKRNEVSPKKKWW